MQQLTPLSTVYIAVRPPPCLGMHREAQKHTQRLDIGSSPDEPISNRKVVVNMLWEYAIVNKDGKVITKTVDFYVAKHIVETHKGLHIKPVKK